MADRELPDDPALWPGDPFALLGVSTVASERDARRAYVRLIKRFKPDHHPDHFQKIREAFEFVQRQLEIRRRFGPLDDNELDDDEPGERDVEDPPGDAAGELMPADEVAARGSYSLVMTPQRSSGQRQIVPAGPTAAQQISALWQQALAGDDAAAYRGLLEVYAQQKAAGGSALGSEAGQLFARLYWLLTLNPQLDGARIPNDWLTEGLGQTRLIGPLAELYRRELASDPWEALSPRCDSLLECPSLPRALCELLLWRWQAAASLRRGDVILADLSRVHEQLVFDDEAAWGQALLHAVELLVWSPDPQVGQRVRAIVSELEQLSHLHQQLGDGYDRLDMLIDVARSWSQVSLASDVPAAWSELIPLAWTRPFEELRPRLVELLRSMATYPLRALRTLDAIHEKSPAATAQLGMLIHRFRVEESGERAPEERPWPQTLDLAAAFFRQKLVGPYYLWRANLLEFCLAEGIDPPQLAAALDEIGAESATAAESLGDAVRNDGPLRYVWSGSAAFWG